MKIMEEEISGFSRLGNQGRSYDIFADLLKYYHRPVETVFDPGDVVSEPDDDIFIWEAIEPDESALGVPKYLERGTQTDYRESEAQTEPWDPPYKIVRMKRDPEVLALKDLTYGKGLPPTSLEVDYAAHTLENKKLTEKLEGDESEDAFLKRNEILKDQIKTNWDYKVAIENEIQLRKLDKMKSSLMRELDRTSEKRGYILKNMWNRKKDEMKKQHDKLEKKLKKEIRSMELCLQNIEQGDSENVSSELAELQNPLKNTKKNRQTKENVDYLLDNFSHSNLQDLLKIKEWLEKKQIALRNNVPLPKLGKLSQRDVLSEEAYQNLLNKKRTKLPPQVYHEDYESHETPLPAVKPEDVADFVDLAEKKIDMVTVWQQILRGLAIQKQMLQLIEKHKDGIENVLSEVQSD